MYQRRCGIQRGFDISHGRQRFVLHLNVLQGIFSQRPRLRHHHRHRLTLPARDIHRQRQLRRRLHALDVFQHTDVRLAHRRHVSPCDHAYHARHPHGSGNIQSRDTRMRMRAAQHGCVQHARQLQVIYVLPAPGEQAFGVGAREGGADVAAIV